MKEIELATINNSKLRQLISNKQSFKLLGCNDRMKETVKDLERLIESQGLRCRIFTKGRAAAAAGGLFVSGIGAIPLAGIGIHKLATYNPDYEIGKNLINHSIEVEYKKEGKDKRGYGD